MTSRKRPLAVIILLIALFVLPILLSWILFSKHVTFGHSTNHGQLITPPFQFSSLNARDDLNQSQQARILHHWVLVVVNPGICDQPCQKSLYALRQIHAATGKDIPRVQRALITLPNSHSIENQLHQVLRSQYRGTLHLTMQRDKSLPSAIFIVDPLGNVMMRYPPTANPRGIMQDIQRLLRVSQIG